MTEPYRTRVTQYVVEKSHFGTYVVRNTRTNVVTTTFGAGEKGKRLAGLAADRWNAILRGEFPK